MRIAAILLFTALIAASGGEEPKSRLNRVSFGSVQSGQTLNVFIASNEGYKKSDPVAWLKFAKTDDTKKIWSPLPLDMPTSQRVLGRIPVTQVSGAEPKCGQTPRLIFISGPPKLAGQAPSLFAYEHIICDNTGLVPPDVMIDQYIAKYGMYDSKDYDRNQVIYDHVQKRYRLAVRPFLSTEDSPGGITVTIVDEALFRDTYFAWRATMKSATKRVQGLF